MDKLEPTIDLARTMDSESVGGETNAQGFSLAPVAKFSDIHSGVTRQFDESTRRLLHNRLLVASTTTLGFLVLIKIVGLLFGDMTLYDLMTRMTASIILAGVAFYLYRTQKVSLRLLRVLEAIIGVALVAECVWVLISESQKLIATGELESLPTLFMAISFAFGIFIAIYGMFIPSNWRRTAAITCLSALLPAIAALVLRQYYPILQTIAGFPGFAAPTLTIAMALVATQAAHVVHKIRRDAESARQYGQYQLLEEIGHGGMGVVYKAKHRMLKRPAAIKLIRTEIADDPRTIEEFEHEVQLSAELTHWNSVQIYDYGRTEAGDFYYVMEHLEGDTLLDRINSRGKLTTEETVNFVSQVCAGLQEAHLKGMVHRDIKPANIFLSCNTGQEDVVKILDFGLAAMKTETDRLQKFSGTPRYMSPEQIKSQTIDERCDIYALGCVIFECLTGQHLFAGETINDLIGEHLHNIPSLDRLPESAGSLREIIATSVEKDPDKRFRNAAALKNALSSCV